MISKSTIRRFIVMFTVCFIVLIGTQLMDVSASDNKTTQEEITHSPQVLNENEQVDLVTSEGVEAGAAEETPEGVEAGAAEETPEGVEAGAAKEAPEGVEAGAAEETPEGVEAGVAEETPKGVEAGVAEETPEGVEAGAAEETPEGLYVPEQQYKVENIQLLTSQPDVLPFEVHIRDFEADYLIFEGKLGLSGGMKNLVSKTLTSSKKPVYTDEGIHQLVTHELGSQVRSDEALANAKKFYQDNKDIPYSTITFDKENKPYDYFVYHLNKLFLNVSGLNMYMQQTLEFNKNKDNLYVFNDSDFFPINDKLLGYQKPGNNYHFTLESHSSFWFGGDRKLTFTFTGDDDVWVYINNKQVIDLGGLHTELSQSFTITPEERDGKIVGVVNGGNGDSFVLDGTGWYDFDFFFMERHTTKSNLKITTNMEFTPKVEIEKIPYMINSQNREVPITSEHVVYPGETVYYKFKVKNSGNVNLTNTKINDPLLNLEIKASGITKDGQPVTDYTVLNNEVVGSLMDLNNLTAKNLEVPATELEIKSNAFKYVVTDSDVGVGGVGQITNTATVSAKHQGEEVFEEARATVNVAVNEIDEEIITLNATVAKSIKTVNGQNYTANMLLKPGDKVVFSVTVTNNSTSENPLTGKVNIAIDKLNLVDILTMGQDTKGDFVFKRGGQEFNVSDFSLPPKQSIELTVEWAVPVPSGAVESNYRGNNKVVLKRKGAQLGESTVSFDVARPKLQIKKEVIGQVDPNQTFDILVTGSDGSTHSLSLTKNQTEVVENLYYGVTYTISEINIPANYQLHSISNNGNLLTNNSITMTAQTNDKLITVKNIERPSLSIEKVIEGEVASNESFVINVRGNDGSQYNVRVEAGQTAVLNNLSYGVDYTISEDRVPMNYELVGINNTGNKSINIQFTESERTDNVIVTNKLVNNKWFFDRQKVENLFKISK